jgi:hypothetical protein
MLVTELKPEEEIISALEGDDSIFVLGCNGCAAACETGGAENVEPLVDLLRENGKKITGQMNIDFLCDKSLVRSRLRLKAAPVMEADSVLVATCGVGVQCVADSVLNRVRPACNTVNMGGSRGTWPSSERCAECGDCLLDRTGGICPITTCSKSMVNGPCGGTTGDGKCEVDGERECGWFRIYERLKDLEALDDLKQIAPPKEYGRYMPSYDRMTSEFWAVDASVEQGGNDE